MFLSSIGDNSYMYHCDKRKWSRQTLDISFSSAILVCYWLTQLIQKSQDILQRSWYAIIGFILNDPKVFANI